MRFLRENKSVVIFLAAVALGMAAMSLRAAFTAQGMPKGVAGKPFETGGRPVEIPTSPSVTGEQLSVHPVFGTIVSVSASEMVVKGEAGKEERFAVTSGTKFIMQDPKTLAAFNSDVNEYLHQTESGGEMALRQTPPTAEMIDGSAEDFSVGEKIIATVDAGGVVMQVVKIVLPPSKRTDY